PIWPLVAQTPDGFPKRDASSAQSRLISGINGLTGAVVTAGCSSFLLVPFPVDSATPTLVPGALLCYLWRSGGGQPAWTYAGEKKEEKRKTSVKTTMESDTVVLEWFLEQIRASPSGLPVKAGLNTVSPRLLYSSLFPAKPSRFRPVQMPSCSQTLSIAPTFGASRLGLPLSAKTPLSSVLISLSECGSPEPICGFLLLLARRRVRLDGRLDAGPSSVDGLLLCEGDESLVRCQMPAGVYCTASALSSLSSTLYTI
ncbi:hypothetical protein P4O66_021951, partial [Electrophorus voltai]